MTTTAAPSVPNHHADQPGFSGIVGMLAGRAMLIGRGSVGRLAAELADIAATDHVVDVSCGPGNAAREAARRGATVTAVDPAPVMLGIARRLTRDHPPLRGDRGVAEALPVADGTATVVWSIATVHHWSDLEAGLNEALRVLQPGGRLLAIERHSRPGARGLASHGWTDAQADAFAERCVAAGFTKREVAKHRVGRTDHLTVTTTRHRPEGR